MDSTLRAEVAAGFSGTVLVASHGTVVLESGYGSIRGTPISTDTRFWIASTAKQFVGAAVLRCQEQGLLSLGDSLGLFFFPNAPSDKRGITIRQLLSHTSGLAQSYVSEAQASRESAVRAMLAVPRDQSQGAAFTYSNSNIQLAVAIVELVSGRSYQVFARRELWAPAGMSSTGFAGDSGATDVAPAFAETPQRLSQSSWGGEGVYSTANDLFRWHEALRNGRVLSRRSTEQLFAPVAAISEGHTGLTWFSSQSPSGYLRVFIRGNEDFGPNSLVYAYPEREIVIVVLTHAGTADAQRSWSRVIHAQLEHLLAL
jgi:CubicO group peptidase (beta-lactamase class C family)